MRLFHGNLFSLDLHDACFSKFITVVNPSVAPYSKGRSRRYSMACRLSSYSHFTVCLRSTSGNVFCANSSTPDQNTPVKSSNIYLWKK